MDNYLITASNIIDLPWQMQRKNNTKSQKRKLRDSQTSLILFSKLGFFTHLPKNKMERCLDSSLLGMCTRRSIREVAGMLLENAHSDLFNVVESKTESGVRSIPIYTDIILEVESMVQNSNNGYLISGMSAKNVSNDWSKGISKRLSRFKNSLGFQDNVYTHHSFRSTLASSFQIVGVEESFAARIIGHKTGGMSYDPYAGDLD